MKMIIRKSMLYKTGVEYGDYTMNHVLGCSHGCKYPCYAFLMAKRFGKVTTYEEWRSPVLVSNTLELLDKEIPKMKNKIQSVQLCFTTDYSKLNIIRFKLSTKEKKYVFQAACGAYDYSCSEFRIIYAVPGWEAFGKVR